MAMTVNNLPSDADLSESYVFVYDQGYLLHSEPQVPVFGSEGLKLTTKADYLWDDKPPTNLDAVVRYKRGGKFYGEIMTFNVGQAVPIGTIDSQADTPVSGAAHNSGLNIWTALIGALLGGLILNLMPCVFPVISMKALSIAKAAHGDVQTIRREAWFYTCLLYTSPSPRDRTRSRMPSSA